MDEQWQTGGQPPFVQEIHEMLTLIAQVAEQRMAELQGVLAELNSVIGEGE